MTATKTRKDSSSIRGRRKSTTDSGQASSVPKRWRNLFACIPGYDPEAGAADLYYFDEEAADYAVGFFPACIRHIKGSLARQPYELGEWEKAVVGCVFGWKRKSDNLRRYRQAFIFVPKKNSKTTLTAGLALAHFNLDDEEGAEIYSAGATKDQASIIFRDVVGMINMCPPMKEKFKAFGASGGGQQRSVWDYGTNSFYRPLASDAGTADGLNVHVAIIDELHRHEDGGALMDILIRGQSTRRQPMTWILTTSDYDRESACNRKYDEACRVRDNGGDPNKPGYDLEFLPVIFEALPTDDWTDEATWYKANPNLGRSKSIDYMRRECAKAKEDPHVRNEFMRYDLNMRTQQTESLIDMVHWDQCPTDNVDDSIYAGPCFAGLDLAQRDDIAALCLCWPGDDPDNDVWAFRWWFWCPEETIRRRTAGAFPYSAWRDDGWLTETDGNDIDFHEIQMTILKAHEQYSIQDLGYDPAMGTQLTQSLYNDHGMTVTPMRQGHITLTDPTKRLCSLVKTHRLNHGGNPVARWHAANAMGRKSEGDCVIPTKAKSKDKIDGISAAVMAVGRAALHVQTNPQCIVF